MRYDIIQTYFLIVSFIYKLLSQVIWSFMSCKIKIFNLNYQIPN